MALIEPLSIDEIITKALDLSKELPKEKHYAVQIKNIKDLQERLSGGKLRIAVLGQFNRGKSTFINKLLGMEILPISVLPITSVPTVISFGDVNECAISFSDGKPNSIIRGDEKAIHGALMQYVTERNNPKNCLHVLEAHVKCESPFLQHGTVMIDTPGFGSTHTHNTQTTLDLLASCDAALFLLSADLPITQVEVDFLKNVIPTVPKIFYIYNKIDLLTSDELKATEHFIKDVLSKKFNVSSDVQLFLVSAKSLGKTKTHDSVWHQSGFESIEREIINFLHKEKYFTLSHALTVKFKDAVTQIISQLQEKYASINKPIAEIKAADLQIRQANEVVRAGLNRTVQFSKIEEKALIDFLQSLIKKRREYILTQLKTRLNELSVSTSGINLENLMNAALNQIFEEIFKNLSLTIINDLNKPFRKAANAHVRELKKCLEAISKEFQTPVEFDLSAVEEKMELNVQDFWKPDQFFKFKPHKGSLILQWLQMLDKKNKQYAQHYLPQITENIDRGIEELVRYTIELIAKNVTAFMAEITTIYNSALQCVASKERDVSKRYEEIATTLEPELNRLETLIQTFSEVKDSA